MQLKTVEGQYGVCQLPADAQIPTWCNGPGFSAIVRTDDELTIVCSDAMIPSGITAARGWACFRSIGPFAFDESGIVARLVTPISDANIGVFVVCTFDGEHILCPKDAYRQVQSILTRAGHHFVS